MRIEIDTKSDSRDDLRHLANMLMALSGSAQNNVVVKQRNIFDDPSPGVGMMSMFGDSQAQSASSSAAQSPAQSQPSMFSIFSDPSPTTQSALSVADDGKKTSAEDLIQDDRIVPYD